MTSGGITVPSTADAAPAQPATTPPCKNGSIDGNCARRGLCKRNQVEHFLLLQHMQMVDKPALHKRHNDKPATQRCRH